MSSVEPVQCLKLDPNQQQNFVRFYKSMPPKSPTTIQIFNRGDYYTCHGPDAKVAGMVVFKTVAGVKYMGVDKPKLEYQVLSKNNFDKLIRDLLLIKQYTVEVYVNQGKNKTVNQWTLDYKGSPGNLAQFEDVLFENGDVIVNAIVMAVKVGKNHMIGVSCVDAHDYTFSVCEFTDNEFFSQLEAIIIQMAPQECILQLNDAEATARLKTVLKRCNINCNTQKKMPFKRDVLAQDLNRLLYFADGQKESCYSIAETSLEIAMASLHATIDYLELLSDQMYFHKFRMKILDTQRLVHLDAAAVKALNLLPLTGLFVHSKKNTYLLGLLDCCKTAQGHRTMAQWVKQPLRDINVLTDRLDIVETFVNDTGLRQVMYKDHLRRIPDLLMLSKRLLRKRAKLRDVYKVYEGISKLPAMLVALRESCNKTIQSMFVDKLSEQLQDMEKFQCMVETTLDMDLIEQGEFLVKSSFQEELQELADTKLQLQEKIQQQLNIVARDLGLEAGKGIKLDYTDQLCYFLRVTLKEEYRLRNKSEYKILNTVKGSARFTTATIDTLNRDYIEAKRSYEQEQKTIATEILQIALGYAETMSNINFLIGQLDVLVTFAVVSCAAPKQYVRPVLLPEGAGRMRIVQMRHPCMEAQDRMCFHPNDIEFKQGECTFHVVTGPNMGGKSTYIRSVGVVALMAHIGCFVPCDEAEIPILDSIMARVGSEDCQAKGLSTFMLEMVETAGILRTATQNSLVIVDELGRGTSTYEGCGLAWSIAETIATENKSFAMFATHFHEITELANEVPTVTNKYVTAMIEENKLVLLYEVRPGICDQSYGIHCAKMAKFPQSLLQHAQEVQDKLEDYRSVKTLQELSIETRQKYVKDGDKLIFNIVDRCKQLDHKRMNDDELTTVMKKFKSELEAANNPYLQGFILQKLNFLTE